VEQFSNVINSKDYWYGAVWRPQTDVGHEQEWDWMPDGGNTPLISPVRSQRQADSTFFSQSA